MPISGKLRLSSARFWTRCTAMTAASLTPEQQVSYDTYEWYLQDLIQGQAFMYMDYPVNPIGVLGAQYAIIGLFVDIQPLTSLEDAARLHQPPGAGENQVRSGDRRVEAARTGRGNRSQARFAMVAGGYRWHRAQPGHIDLLLHQLPEETVRCGGNQRC